jgi:hypothetical protein
LLFIANPTACALTDTVTFDGTKDFTPVWGDGPSGERSGSLEIEIAPYTVRILEVRDR